mmetsp:Transcript_17160/g.38992  ORF Transcript_17160/g.38992 Transcript_17160/m.38992 type:complete len:117 (+) Transcript_17160:365-715(+)
MCRIDWRESIHAPCIEQTQQSFFYLASLDQALNLTRTVCPKVTETCNGVSFNQSPHPMSAPALCILIAISASPSWQYCKRLSFRMVFLCFRIVIRMSLKTGHGNSVSSIGVLSPLS